MATWGREPGTQGAPWDAALSSRFRICLFPGTVKHSRNTLRHPSGEVGGNKHQKESGIVPEGEGVRAGLGSHQPLFQRVVRLIEPWSAIHSLTWVPLDICLIITTTLLGGTVIPISEMSTRRQKEV